MLYARNFLHFKEKFDVVELNQGQDMTPHVHDAHGILIKMGEHLTKQIIDSAPHLKVASRHGAGYENVDVAHCVSKKIWVTNTPGVIANATADVALLHLLNVSRRFSESERSLRSGQFEGSNFMGHDPEEKTLGILGMGAIGKQIAKRAAAFDMKVIYHTRTKLPEEVEKKCGNSTYVTKDQLLSTSDYISINVPYNKQTYHIIDVEDFQKMKTGVVIINTSRGQTVNEQALVDALKTGKVGGAGLDVFEQEPKVHPELYHLPNVSLTPHIGTATIESRRDMEELALVNVEAALDGKAPPNPVPECNGY